MDLVISAMAFIDSVIVSFVDELSSKKPASVLRRVTSVVTQENTA